MKKITRFLLVLGIISLLGMPLAACASAPQQATSAPQQPTTAPQQPAPAQLEGNITISGAFALYPMMTRWAEEFQKVNPKVTFDISAGGAGKGMTDALSGAVDMGMVSRAVTSDEEAKGAFWIGVVKDAVFPVVNEKNPVLQDILKQGIKQETFIGIFITGEIKTWGQVVGKPEITDEIHVYTRSDACGAADIWAKYLGNKKQEDLKGVGVSGDPGLLDAVVKDPLGIGYNNLGYVFDNTTGKPVAGAVPAPIDKDGNGQAGPDELIQTSAQAVDLIVQGKYPEPPARVENLVTKGKPTGLVLAFLQWILNDGQKFVGEAGYVQLPQDQLNTALQKIK
jgi:phosphate transport system substrate-binding protein